MAINNFEFPGVTLSQEFTSAPTSGTAVLGVVCIGPQYLWYTDAANPLTAVVSGGAVATTSPAVIASGAYVLGTDSVAKGVAVTSGLYAYTSTTAAAAISATSGGTVVVPTAALSSKTIAGDALVVKGGTAYIITGITSGEENTSLTLLNTGTDEPATGVVIASAGVYYIARGVDSYTHVTGGTVSITGNTITGTVNAPDCTITNAALLNDPADTASACLVAGTASVLCGVRVTGGSASFTNARGSVSDPADVEKVLGAIASANPLAVATYCASVEAKGNAVYFLAAADDTPAAYREAIAKLEKYDDIYSIVLAIQGGSASEAIIRAAMAEVSAESEDKESKVRRTLWYGADPTETTATLKIQETIAQRYTTSYRAQCVFAEGVMVDGALVGSYAAAAAAAGMRSYEAVHRPLSNLPFTAFTVTDTLSRADQREIAKNGIWIVANNSNGIPVTLRQLTTAVANNVNEDEESIIANADEIALTLCHVGEDKVGCSNIHPQLLMSLSDDITLNMDAKLLNKSGSISVGPQLLSWELVELKQDPQALDHVYAIVDCEPPKPFNRFHITLRVL